MKNDYKQFVADLYHCSETWGTIMTVKDMYILLSEYIKTKEPDEYCPKLEQAKQCAIYWNKLAKLYPY